MKLHMDSADNLYKVSAYDGVSVTVAEERLTETFALTPHAVFRSVAADSVDTLAWSRFPELHGTAIDILLVGTGERQRFPASSFYAELAAVHIGLEVMDTGAACRTYNILVGEGRRVAAILMLDA